MSKKNRISGRLESGEAYVVGLGANFEHIASTYETLAVTESQSEADKRKWLEVAAWIRSWLNDTYYETEMDEEEDW